jgi:SpoVK/Ycf46/Vps4 family AAA+-type ATPase
MKQTGKEFVITDTRTGKELARIQNLEEFLGFLDEQGYEDMHNSLIHHKIKGDLHRWFEAIGEKEFAKGMKPFDKKSIFMYDAAANIFYDNLKRKKQDMSGIVGYNAVKEQLRELIVYPDKMKELSAKYCRNSTGSVMFYGPPGCGKTYIANAVAGETSKMFVKKSISNVLHAYVAEVLKLIGNAVLFVDEIETIAANRYMEGLGARGLTAEFLTMLDSLYEKQGIFVIGATNAPWLLDNAIVRSGRFDNLVYVGIPDHETRAELFKFYSKGLPLGSIDFEALAMKTDFHSCSDIAEICKEAAVVPWREALAGKEERNVETRDFETAISKTPSTAISWFEDAAGIMCQDNVKKRFEPMFEEIERYRKKRH